MSVVERAQAADEAFFGSLWARNDAGEDERLSRAGIKYGTAGFRRRGSTLHGVAFRCGILASLRSRALGGKATGIVITASHNPVEDNGVKLIDGDGGMLHMSWEKHAESIVSAQTSQGLCRTIHEVISSEGVRAETGDEAGVVFIARDTRPTGEGLIAAAIKGIEAIGSAIVGSAGTLRTTPQLHWQVLMRNTDERCDEADYFARLRTGCLSLLSKVESKDDSARIPQLTIDCANGVGALKISSVTEAIETSGNGTVVVLRNTGEGVVNHLCGADYVQKERVLPTSFQGEVAPESLCASLDGDADRVVFFSSPPSSAPPAPGGGGGGGGIDLLDGDKILCLIASHLKERVSRLDGALEPKPAMGVVQTAYANGSSTRYLQRNLGLEVVRTKTGVKHLHHAALDFDLAVYFEANGHGTVVFSGHFLERLRALKDNQDARHLLEVAEIVNPAIGDALSITLLVYAILTLKGWTHADWHGLYADVPSRMLKCVVPDRSLIKTINAEQEMEDPKELQVAVDALIARVSLGRAFVRPSGTEDVVRVYAEAETQKEADWLAHEIKAKVSEYFSN